MAYKQPRTPEMQKGEKLERVVRTITLFLHDFCMEAWAANGRRKREIEALNRRVTALEDEARRE